jgi:hypothetical protein
VKGDVSAALLIVALFCLTTALLHLLTAALSGQGQLRSGRTAALWLADAAAAFAVLDLVQRFWQGAAVLAAFAGLAVVVFALLGRRDRDSGS